MTEGNYITLKFGKRKIDALVDSVATVSVISQRVARELNFTVNPGTQQDKIVLFSASGTKMPVIGIADIRLYLAGFVLSANGIEMSSKRTEAIKHISSPKIAISLRILGMMNFYRHFIKNYSQRTFHMRKLLCKGQKFIWTAECDKELEYLKQALTKPPILRPMDPRLPVIIQTD